MISFLEGKIEHMEDKNVIINAGGIGYRVHIMPKVVLALRTQGLDPVRLFIHSQLNMREGTFDLYGFKAKEDLEIFNLLISVNGIGPKNAMNIMGTVEPRYLKAAVMNDDAAYLKKVSGLGPKTAQRLILELKNKVDHIDLGDMVGVNLNEEHQAVEALMTLGYSQSVAQETLKDIKMSRLEDRVRDALKILGKK